MSVFLGLDVGMGGARAVAVDEVGSVVAEASSGHPLLSPRPGWTEQRGGDWWRASKEALEIPSEWMPKVYEGPESTGGLNGEVATDLGLPPGIPVAAGGGDNAAAAVGGVVEEGLLSSSVGTSGVLFAATDAFTPDPSSRIHAFCHAFPKGYHLMGVTLSAGGSLSWWRDVMGADYDMLVYPTHREALRRLSEFATGVH